MWWRRNRRDETLEDVVWVQPLPSGEGVFGPSLDPAVPAKEPADLPPIVDYAEWDRTITPPGFVDGLPFIWDPAEKKKAKLLDEVPHLLRTVFGGRVFFWGGVRKCSPRMPSVILKTLWVSLQPSLVTQVAGHSSFEPSVTQY